MVKKYGKKNAEQNKMAKESQVKNFLCWYSNPSPLKSSPCLLHHMSPSLKRLCEINIF